MSALDILNILSRLEAACERRRELTGQRSALIGEFQRTGQRANSYEFAQVNENLRTTGMEIAGLQGALDAIKAIGGGQ